MAVLLALPAVLALNALVGLVLALPGGWTLMLMFGVLHAHVSREVPLIGYGVAYPIALLAGWFYLFLTTNGSGGSSD